MLLSLSLCPTEYSPFTVHTFLIYLPNAYPPFKELNPILPKALKLYPPSTFDTVLSTTPMWAHNPLLPAVPSLFPLYHYCLFPCLFPSGVPEFFEGLDVVSSTPRTTNIVGVQSMFVEWMTEWTDEGMNEDLSILLSFRKQYSTYWASWKHSALRKEGQVERLGRWEKRVSLWLSWPFCLAKAPLAQYTA